MKKIALIAMASLALAGGLAYFFLAGPGKGNAASASASPARGELVLQDPDEAWKKSWRERGFYDPKTDTYDQGCLMTHE